MNNNTVCMPIDGSNYVFATVVVFLIANLLYGLMCMSMINHSHTLIAYAMQNSDPSHDFIKKVLVMAAHVLEVHSKDPKPEESHDEPSTPSSASSA